MQAWRINELTFELLEMLLKNSIGLFITNPMKAKSIDITSLHYSALPCIKGSPETKSSQELGNYLRKQTRKYIFRIMIFIIGWQEDPRRSVFYSDWNIWKTNTQPSSTNMWSC